MGSLRDNSTPSHIFNSVERYTGDRSIYVPSVSKINHSENNHWQASFTECGQGYHMCEIPKYGIILFPIINALDNRRQQLWR